MDVNKGSFVIMKGIRTTSLYMLMGDLVRGGVKSFLIIRWSLVQSWTWNLALMITTWSKKNISSSMKCTVFGSENMILKNCSRDGACSSKVVFGWIWSGGCTLRINGVQWERILACHEEVSNVVDLWAKGKIVRISSSKVK